MWVLKNPLNLFLGYAQAFFVIVHPGTVRVVTIVTGWFGHAAGVVYPGGDVGGVITTEVAGAEVGGVHGDLTGIHGGHQVADESHHKDDHKNESQGQLLHIKSHIKLRFVVVSVISVYYWFGLIVSGGCGGGALSGAGNSAGGVYFGYGGVICGVVCQVEAEITDIHGNGQIT